MKKALELALEALWTTANPKAEEAITAIKEALAQPAQQERVQTDSLADIGAAYKDIHACLTETLQLSRKQNGHSRQPAQEPVSVTYKEVADAMNSLWNGTLEQHQIAEQMANKKLYTTPQQRPWVGLTDEEIDYLYVEHRGDGGPTAICEQFAKAYETYLKEKNNG